MKRKQKNFQIPLFEEKLLPCYLPGGYRSHRKIFFTACSYRGVNAVLIMLFTFMIWVQFKDNVFGAIAIFCEALIVFAIIMLFIHSEILVYGKEGRSSRPIIIFSNGLIIPPLYLKTLINDGGFVQMEDIDFIEVKWHKLYITTFGYHSGIIWYDAPVEFIVHTKNGKRIRSAPRPPETIRDAVNVMHNAWGVRVERGSFGNGKMKKIVDNKVVEEREL